MATLKDTESTAFSPSYDSHRFSQNSRRFRESTHLIPSPGTEGRKVKRYNPWILSLPVVIGTPLLMLAMGIGLEVAVNLSVKFGGFKVPSVNVFGTVSGQFLSSFIPTLLIIPAAFTWRELDWNLRLFQPYVLLQKGNASAEEALLLDYVLIFWSSITASITYIFQPLGRLLYLFIYKLSHRSPISWVHISDSASSTDRRYDGTVTSIKSIGLDPNVQDLTAFVAAAGFAEAAVFHHLPDPPFITGGWATAEFVFPTNVGLNGSMTVNTTGIQTSTNCANPAAPPSLQAITGSLTFNLSSKSTEGCTSSVLIDPSTALQQYGVLPAQCSSTPPNLDITFLPVMFWFVVLLYNNQLEAKTVFCSPSIKAFNVTASASLNDGSLTAVTKLSDYTPPNNVTGGELAGKAFNGVVFDNSTNPFIQARATATNSGVPGAVFRFASQLPNGPQSTFDLPNGFLDITSTVYTQHLSITAKSIYFVNFNNTLPADMISILPRLWIDPLPAHALAFFLFSIGFLGVFLHIINRRQREKLLLAAPPGSIASIVALTARSGFGDLLLPYDNALTLEKKLDGLKFRLDRRTGAILAEDDGPEGVVVGRDDAMLSLLGKDRQSTPMQAGSSTDLAYQTAVGYPPHQGPLRTPYDT
ncbi:hypothetical protein BDQ12DRAFT_605866 [Crucibulum laeve]|uniref:Uncharacterized protein n=1 Tax=Crucibulum laeve TaxID=68775 RepID=A0A5C3M274_9AGAR|nr:hypothetical protein BDQ12DRAFT_605866 [Crucibulum laeve]